MNDLQCYIRRLIGKRLTSITISEDRDVINFITDSGEAYKMYHERDCCEIVSVEDIAGDLGDLIDSPILYAEETYSDPNSSILWTFYNIGTLKGHVTIRWKGEDDGYYSKEVSFKKVS